MVLFSHLDEPQLAQAHSDEFLREMVHLRPRLATPAAILRVRHSLAKASTGYLDSLGFISVSTPVLTSNDCEGGGELFSVVAADTETEESGHGSAADLAAHAGETKALPAEGRGDGRAGFFGKPVYLTVSGQLHLEAFALALGRVYTFGPTFRAENSRTGRHAAEFWMLEPELVPGGMHDAVSGTESG